MRKLYLYINGELRHVSTLNYVGNSIAQKQLMENEIELLKKTYSLHAIVNWEIYLVGSAG